MHGGAAQPGGQQPVEGRGRAAPLHVAQHRHPHAEAQLVAVGVQVFDNRLRARLVPLGDGDDAVRLAADVGVLQLRRHLLQGGFHLRDEHHLRAAGDAAHQRQVAAIPPHDLDEESAAVRGSGVLDAVNVLQHRVQRRVHADAHVGVGDVVVNGAGHADDGKAHLVQLERPAEGAVAADDHQPLHAVAVEVAQCSLAAFLRPELLGAGGAQDGAAAAEDAAHRAGVHLPHPAVNQALVATLDAHGAHAQAQGGAHHGADTGIETGAIAPAT